MNRYFIKNQQLKLLIRFFVVSLALFLMSACTPKNNDNNNDTIKPIFLGDLDKKAQEIYSDPNGVFYTCDERLKPTVLQIARAVENQRANIQILAEEALNPEIYEKVNVNGFQFLKKKVSTPFQDKWEEAGDGWDEALEVFKLIEDKPRDPRWVYLNNLVRSLILEDETRIRFGQHPGLRRELEPLIVQIIEKLESCFLAPSCFDPKLNSSEIAWAEQSPYVKDLISWMSDSAKSIETRRKYLNWMLKNIKGSARRFDFRKNDFITMQDNVVTVPLDLSVFKDDAGILVNAIEEAWSLHGLKVKIRNETSNSFKVLISDEPGERAFVSYNENIMQLYTPAKLTTLAHEFGHILGLRDEYFTSFDTKLCKYIDQWNLGDIMSTGSTGLVLPEHIMKIKEIYSVR